MIYLFYLYPNKMKGLKRGIFAFLAGEFLTLIKKDQTFKQGVREKTGREKAKHILDGLFTFNKQLVEEAKQHFDSASLQNHLHQGAEWVKNELQTILEEIKELQSKKSLITQEIMTTLHNRFGELQQTAALVKNTITDYPLEEKLLEGKKLLESLAKGTKKQ